MRTNRESRRGIWALFGLLLATAFMASVTLIGASPAQPYGGIGIVAHGDTVDAFGLTVVTEGHGAGTLVGTLLNEGSRPDLLLDVTTTSELGPIPTTVADPPVRLGVEQPLQMHEYDLVTLRSPKLRPGYMIEVTFAFQSGQDITTVVPVEPATGPYRHIDVPA